MRWSVSVISVHITTSVLQDNIPSVEYFTVLRTAADLKHGVGTLATVSICSSCVRIVDDIFRPSAYRLWSQFRLLPFNSTQATFTCFSIRAEIYSLLAFSKRLVESIFGAHLEHIPFCIFREITNIRYSRQSRHASIYGRETCMVA